MSTERRKSVKEFFESYRAAFEALDAPAITDLFAFPLHVTGDAGEISIDVIETSEAWLEQVARLLDMYRAIGFSSAGILEMAATELSPRLIQVVVRWGLYGREGGLLYEFRAMYTLVEIHDSLRIAAISHDEIPRYRAGLSKLRSERG